METMKIKKMTSIENKILDKFPIPLKNIAHIDLSYQSMLHTIRKHIGTIYGEDCVNWKNEISQYLMSDGCHIAKSCDSIPEITFDEIQDMISCEEDFRQKVKYLMELPLNDDKASNYSEILMNAAGTLGLLSDVPNGILSHMICFNDKNKKIGEENLKLLQIVVTSLIDSFRAGFQYTYPIIETAMTQPKTRYYYRGENAYYGTSKASIYRNRNNKLPEFVAQIIEFFKIDEGCAFLDCFDAVSRWGNSNINYLALAQHYGLKTPMIDITGDIKTALFFACCKYGSDGMWHPLEASDFEKADSRKEIYKRGGDSRYGVLYMCPTEIQDMALLYDGDQGNVVLPVGYQPFMRCKNQYAYMYMAKSNEHDMLKDPMFLKMKFRINKEICNWIYNEMDGGELIYPHKDIPDLSPYFAAINETYHFSKETFDRFIRDNAFDEAESKAVQEILQQYGYHIISGHREYLSYNKLRKINKRYPVEKAFEYTEIFPISRPRLIIG